MITQVGRNDPCPCGSGKKYKKCCLSEEGAVLHMAKEMIAKQQAEKAKLAKIGIFINYVKPVIYTNPKTGKESKVWAIGNRLFHSRRAEETFHEFIIENLRITLGKDWWDKEVLTHPPASPSRKAGEG